VQRARLPALVRLPDAGSAFDMPNLQALRGPMEVKKTSSIDDPPASPQSLS
jgi:hypothetical protein